MLRNLYAYIGVVTKYILVFDAESGESNSNYVVFDELEDTGVADFVRNCRTIKQNDLFDRAIGDAQRYSCARQGMALMPEDNRVYYHCHIFGAREVACKPYQSLIQTNSGTKFEIIPVPISKPLFEKVLKLSEHHVPHFTSAEVCALIEHLLPFKDKRALLAYVVYLYLQNHPSFAHQVLACHSEEPCRHTPLAQFFAAFVFGTGHAADGFAPLISSNVVVRLQDEHGIIAEISSSSLCNKPIYHRVKLDTPLFGFMFDCLSVSYRCLTEHEAALQHVLHIGMRKGPLTVKIQNIDEREERAHQRTPSDVLRHRLCFLSTCGLLQYRHISEIILEFHRITVPVSTMRFNEGIGITAVCYHCSVEFIDSLLRKVKIVSASICGANSRTINRVHRNVAKLSYTKCSFDGRILVPRTVQDYEMFCCDATPDTSFRFKGECCSIAVRGVQTTIYPSGNAGFSRIMLQSTDSHFMFSAGKGSESSFLKLKNAKIGLKTCINENVHSVKFVGVTADQEIEFDGRNTCLHVLESSGWFDLWPFMCTKLCLKRNMVIKVSPIPDSLHDLSHILLCNIGLDHTLTLPDCYRHAELENVSTFGDACLVLGENCKELSVKACCGVLDLRKAEYLDRLTVELSVAERNNVRFVGVRRVGHLHCRNVCRDIDVIKSLLLGLERVDYLQFTSDYSAVRYHDIRLYYSTRPFSLPPSRNLGCIPTQQHRESPLNRDTPWVYIHSTTNVLVNRALRMVLRRPAVKNLARLELTLICVTGSNCKLLKRLKHLEVLKVSTACLTSEFFTNLPRMLRMMDITDTYIRKHRTTRRVSGPLNIKHTFNDLKVLAIDACAFVHLTAIFSLAPTLKVLRVRNTEIPPHSLPMVARKVQLQECFIECAYHLIAPDAMYVTRPDLTSLIELLSQHIDFHALESLVIMSSDELVLIHPLSYRIVSRRPAYVLRAFD